MTALPVSIHVVALAVSAGVTAGLAVYGWRQRPDPGATSFAAFCISAAVWTAAYGVGLTVPADESGLRLFWEQVMWVGITPIPVAWLAFAVDYSGVDLRLTRRRLAALSTVPVVGLAATLTIPLQSSPLFWGIGEVTAVGDGLGASVTVVFYDFGPLFGPYYAYVGALLVAGMVLLLRTSVTADGLYLDQAIALVVGAVVPLVANAASVVGAVPVPGMDFTPHAYAVTGVAFGNALLRYRFLDRLPAVRRAGRDSLVRNMRDGVVVVDDQGTVIDVNPVGERILADARGDRETGDPGDRETGDPGDRETGDPGERRAGPGDGRGGPGTNDGSQASPVGRPARSVFADALPDREFGDDPVAEMDGAEFQLADGRWFEARASPLSDHRDRSRGDVLVFRDVTDRHAREQRLSVLNRLLRHNFRNEMTVVMGRAELLAARLDGEDAESAELIAEVAGRLTDHADKARELERMMDREDEPPRPVDAVGVVADALETVDDVYPRVETTLSAPESAEVYSNGSLDTVVENLVENAAEHGSTGSRTESDDAAQHDYPPGVVDVTVRTEGEHVVVEIADDGPGIPEEELTPIEAGTETPLEHGSGLGLWLVHWGVEALGGTVEFEVDDGTVARLRLPAVDPEPESGTESGSGSNPAGGRGTEADGDARGSGAGTRPTGGDRPPVETDG